MSHKNEREKAREKNDWKKKKEKKRNWKKEEMVRDKEAGGWKNYRDKEEKAD